MSPAKYSPHVFKEGECFSELAYRRRAEPDDVWSHVKNQELQACRSDKDMLELGDLVYLPAASAGSSPTVEHQSTNKVVGAMFQRPPYPPILLAQEDGSYCHNFAVNLRLVRCEEPTDISFAGTSLESKTDYVLDGYDVFFKPPGAVDGDCDAIVTFQDGSTSTYSLRVAQSMAERMDSLYAQSLNLRSLALAIRKQAHDHGLKSSAPAAIEESLFLTAFYVRQAILDELELSIDSRDEWNDFAARVKRLPLLRPR